MIPTAAVISEVQAAANKMVRDMDEKRALQVMASANLVGVDRATAIAAAGALIAAIAWDDDDEAKKRNANASSRAEELPPAGT